MRVVQLAERVSLELQVVKARSVGGPCNKRWRQVLYQSAALIGGVKSLIHPRTCISPSPQAFILNLHSWDVYRNLGEKGQLGFVNAIYSGKRGILWLRRFQEWTPKSHSLSESSE